MPPTQSCFFQVGSCGEVLRGPKLAVVTEKNNWAFDYLGKKQTNKLMSEDILKMKDDIPLIHQHFNKHSPL